MWSYLAAPFLVLVPARWRRDVIFAAPVHWRVASFMCGVVQCVSGFGALVWWYSYSVTTWTDRVMEHALQTQQAVGELKADAVGLLGLTIVAASPVTWLIALWCLEGIARILAAAITEEVFATLPLALIAGVAILVRPISAENPGLRAASGLAPDETLDRSPASGFAAFLRRGVMARTHARVLDQVILLKDADGEVLKICASHTKEEWEVGRMLRVDGEFYRIESFTERHGNAAFSVAAQDDGLPRVSRAAAAVSDGYARPFVYKLRRLGAGVMNRNVLTYELPENCAVSGHAEDLHQLQRK